MKGRWFKKLLSGTAMGLRLKTDNKSCICRTHLEGMMGSLLGQLLYCHCLSLPCREKLKQLIEKRIGRENFIEKLGFISKHELYSRAAQKPQPCFSSPDHMMFDHEFTKLVKELEGETLHSFL